MLSRLWLYVMNNNIEHFLELKISQNQKVNSPRIILENSQREKNERILESLLPSPPLLLSSSLDFLKKRKWEKIKNLKIEKKIKKNVPGGRLDAFAHLGVESILQVAFPLLQLGEYQLMVDQIERNRLFQYTWYQLIVLNLLDPIPLAGGGA